VRILAQQFQLISDFLFGARHNGRYSGVLVQLLSASRPPNYNRYPRLPG
jgi:hypothetical protein